jgi:phosphate transport system substrate-binding protein
MKRFQIYTLMSVLVICTLLLGACAKAPESNTQQGTIAVSGAFALYPMMVKWAEEYQNLNPGVRIDVSAGGAGKGMADALSGAVDIGMVSREIKPEEEQKGAYAVPVVKDAVFPVVSAQNPYAQDIMSKGVSQATFRKIFITGEITTWGEVIGKPEVKEAIHVYTRSDSCGAAEMWAKYCGGKAQEELKGIGVNGDPGILETVIKDSLGIGYNNLNYVFDQTTGKPVVGAVVIPLDKDKNGIADPNEVIDTKAKAVEAVANGEYPSPPARVLFLVTNNKPAGTTQDFILWILNDGQKFVKENGYITLPEGDIQAAKDKLAK